MSHALVIYESMFGNTRQVAEAIGEGLADHGRVEVLEVSDAPATIPEGVSLLVVGGPTHASGMSRPSTRADAATQTNASLVSTGDGVREWLDQLEALASGVRSASFDTHMDRPHVIAKVGSAAGPIHRRLHKLGLETTAEPEHFWVADSTGPLRDGERDRAREWGANLAS